MKKSKNTRKFRLQAKRRQDRRRQSRFDLNVKFLVAGGYPEREARSLVRHMNRVISAGFPGERITVISVIPVSDQFVEESVMAPAMIVDSPAAVVATEQPNPVSDTDSPLESVAKMAAPEQIAGAELLPESDFYSLGVTKMAAPHASYVPSPEEEAMIPEFLAARSGNSEQLPPPPAYIEVSNAFIFGEPIILTPGPEAPPEIAPAFCGCQGGYRAATRQDIPAPKKLGFFGRVKQGVNDFVVNHSSRRGGRNYRGQ